MHLRLLDLRVVGYLPPSPSFTYYSLIFSLRGCELLAQAAQGGCGCPLPVGVQDQIEWGPGQPGLVPDMKADGPACGREAGT